MGPINHASLWLIRKKLASTSKQVPQKSSPPKERKIVSSEALPRRTLEEALRVAQIIRDTYAGKTASWPEIAKALGVSEKHPTNRCPLWSAVAYGIVIKESDKSYSLAETGRKILAPTYEGEREEGIKKALFTPSVLSRFYTDYNGSSIPSDELFPNVLEARYDVPRNRTAEAIEILKENARFAGALVKRLDDKEGLEFSDIAFPVQKPRSTESLTQPDSSIEVLPTIADTDADSGAGHEDWENVCFVITPIGAEDSVERKHADTMLRALLI